MVHLSNSSRATEPSKTITVGGSVWLWRQTNDLLRSCPLYTSDAADDLLRVDLGGRRIIKKKKKKTHKKRALLNHNNNNNELQI